MTTFLPSSIRIHFPRWIKDERLILSAILIVGLLIRLAFIKATVGGGSDEVYAFFMESRSLGERGLSDIYLGGIAFEGGWRIPSFIFFSLNFFIYHLFGFQGLWTFVALINVLAVYLSYLLVRHLYPDKTHYALWTALLIAITPFPIFYSNGPWTPNFILPLSVSIFWFYYRWIVDRRESALFFLSFFLCVLTQYHLITTGLMFAIGLAAILYRPPLSLKLMLIAAMPWIVYIGFYFYFENQLGYPNTKMMFNHGVGNNTKTLFDNLSYIVSAASVGSNEISIGFKWIPPTLYDFYREYFFVGWIPFLFNGLHFFYIYTSFVYLSIPAYRSFKTHSFRYFLLSRKKEIIIAIWVFFHIGTLVILQKSYNTRYAIVDIPFVFLVQVVFFFRIRGLKSFWMKFLRYFFLVNILFMFYLDMAMIACARENILKSTRPTVERLYRILGVVFADSQKTETFPVFMETEYSNQREKENIRIYNGFIRGSFAKGYYTRVYPQTGHPTPPEKLSYYALGLEGNRHSFAENTYRLLVRVGNVDVYKNTALSKAKPGN